MRTERARWRMTGAVLLLAGWGIGGLLPTWAQNTTQGQAREFNVPAQSATTGIPEFARQAGIQILVSEPLVRGRRTTAVTGSHAVDEGLAILLNGTSLVATSSDGVTYTLRVGPAGDPAPDPSASSSSGQTMQLEEITVTARRREEKIQEVPIAITAVSQQTLADNNVHSIGDLQYLVPSLSTNTINSRDAIYLNIRGQGISAADLPGVVLYLNEIPLPQTSSVGTSAGGPGLLFDLENVQVLKGPQGTLFGRNSVGGAVLLQAAQPKNELGGHVQVSYGNYNDREVDGAINIPVVSDVLLTRLAFNGQKRNGFTRVEGEPAYPNGVEADNQDHWSVRGTVSFRPDQRFQNDTAITYLTYKDVQSPDFLTAVDPSGLVPTIYNPAFAGYFAQQTALGDRTHIPVAVDTPSSGTTLFLNNTTKVQIADNVTFRNIAGVVNGRTLSGSDADGTLLPIIDIFPASPSRFRQYSEEAQLLGNAFENRLNWIGGVFYSHQPSQAFEPFVQVTLGNPSPVAPQQYSNFGNRTTAIFAQSTFDLSQWVRNVSLTTGVRYTWDKYFSTNISGPSLAGTPVVTNGTGEALTWTGSLEYRPVEHTMLYTTVSRGYRPGGANTPDPTGFLAPEYKPEYVISYELGTKSDWSVAGLPVRTNAAIYYQDYSDIQESEDHLTGNPLRLYNYIANATAAYIWGAELEAWMKVTSRLEFGLNYDHIYFQYKAFSSVISASTAESLEIDRTSNRPPNKYGVNAQYRVPLAADAGDLSVRANWNWQATSGNAGSSFGGGLIPAFGLLNLSANWNRIAGGPLDVSLFASNVLDKEYRIGGQGLGGTTSNAVVNLGYDIYRFGEPRMYGLRLNYRFGGEAK